MYLFIFLFFSNSLYAESMHFDCKCNFFKKRVLEFGNNETSIYNNYCADVHLEIKPDTKEIRTLTKEEYAFFQDIEVTDISFTWKLEGDDYLHIKRFDRYTSTLTQHTRSIDKALNTKTYYEEVFRCEKVDKKY